MTKQVINLGTAPSGTGGDDRRSAWVKAIANFDEIYAAFGGNSIPAALPVAKGGTGGTTAAAARTGLGLGAAAVAAILGNVASGTALQQVITNANGTAYRFANGMQVCVLPRGSGAQTASVGATAVGNFLWTFPAPFANLNYSPAASFEPMQSVDHFGYIHTGNWGTASCTLWVRNGPAVAQAFIVSAIAVGSWQ